MYCTNLATTVGYSWPKKGKKHRMCLSIGQKSKIQCSVKLITIITYTLILPIPKQLLHHRRYDVVEEPSEAPKQPKATILQLGGATQVVGLTRSGRRLVVGPRGVLQQGVLDRNLSPGRTAATRSPAAAIGP